MSRHGSNALSQMIGAHVKRFGTMPPVITPGTIVSYDPVQNMAIAHIDFGDGFEFDTPLSQIMVPWHGPGYSDTSGPEAGQQCMVGIIDLEGDIFVILGYTATDDANGINVPAGEKKVLDKRGSFVHHAAARGGSIRSFGAAYATLFGATGTEVGGENLDPVENAIIRKSDLDAALAAQVTMLMAQFKLYLAASVQPGQGAPPITLTAVTSTGSTTTRAAN